MRQGRMRKIILHCAGAVGLALATAFAAAQPQPDAGPPQALPPYDEVADHEEAAGVVAELQEKLAGLGISDRIRSCKIILEVRDGNRTHTYGAICSVGEKEQKHLLMCIDHGIGNFALGTTFPHDADAVHLFARRACSEGPWTPLEVDDVGPIGNTTF